MSNGKIFYNNLISSSTLGGGTPVTGYETKYLADNNPGTVWRSAIVPPNTGIVTMSFNGVTPVKGIVVLNHNLVSGDTFKFEASTLSDFSTVAESEDIDLPQGYVEVNWEYQYYRLVMTKSTGSYYQLGEIYLFGSSYEFDRNFKWNYTFTREINRNAKQTTSGQVYRKTRFIRGGFTLDFEGITDDQKTKFEAISENDYICFLPFGDSTQMYYGTIDFSAFTNVYTNFWNVNAAFTESPK
jgi:hypothetical protein